MGARGPVPKRSSARRRRNAESRPDKVAATGVVRVPACPRGAHRIAAHWYRALRQSGQAQFFEPSDWSAALLVVEQMDRLLGSTRAINGPAFTALWSAMADLFTTEAARRRARMEVERLAADEQAPPGVSAIDDYRQRMAASGQ